jgi:YVTN family beta-propeller protein
VARIKFPEGGFHAARVYDHGIGIAPNGKTLWVNGNLTDPNGCVYVYSLPDLKLLGNAPTGIQPRWIAFSPDSKKVYDANQGDHTVSVIDAKTLKEVARIPVGNRPYNPTTLLIR